jgi:hypothetical protein
MRTKLINEILDLAGDEFGREELIELAKEKDYQLRIRLIHIKKMTQYEINQINNYESK